ncbi:MAG TPA: hypothetical protein PLS66_03120 [Tepiditoga sp.]|nr:hypothetical protein [Tepiditoga sp.]
MFNIFRKKEDNKIFYTEGNSIVFYFKCSNCGEKFRTHLRKGYDFINDYDNNTFIVDKEFIGSKCFEKIYLKATFSSSYKLIDFELKNAEIIKKEDMTSNE